MANKRYYWLKLKNNFFIQPKIKKLRSLENGADLTIIYLKMQLLSIENEGVIYFEGLEEDIDSEVAFLIDEDVEFVKKTIAFLVHHELIEVISDELHLPETKASIGSETDKAESMRKLRKRRKEELLQNNENVTSYSNNVTIALPDVTNRYTEIEKDIENKEEIEKIKEDSQLSINHLSQQEYQKKFFEFYDLYPEKSYKDKALNYWLSQNYDNKTIEDIFNGVKKYAKEQLKTYKSARYFLEDEVWKKYIKIEKEIPGMDVIEEEMFRDLYK